jgi:hypothetical protein
MTMPDDDLDGLLKTWTVPRSPDSLERRLRLAYRDRVRSRTRAHHNGIARLLHIAGKFAVVITAAVILLAVIAKAFPQALNLVVPSGAITLDSEVLDYKDDGSYTVSEYRTSSFRRPTVEGDFLDGGETILSESFPGDPFKTVARNLLDPVMAMAVPISHRLFDPLFYKPKRAEYLKAIEENATDRIRDRCTSVPPPTTVIGTETVLNYATTVVRTERGNVRTTAWVAPELSCYPLISAVEKPNAEGTFRLVSERRVLKVTKNPVASEAPHQNR